MNPPSTLTETPAAVGRPTALQVEITSACNLKCKMCPLTLGATLTSVRAEDMQEATWSEVVAAACWARRVVLTGFGESTINPRFLDLIRELDGLGVYTSFSTNAIPIRPETVAELATLEWLDHINVSIDSPDPEVYREIRGGKLEKALRGLRLLVEGLPPRVVISVSSVAMASNVESLLAFPALLGAIGVRIYNVQGLHDRTGAVLDEDDVGRHPRSSEILRELRRGCDERGIKLGIPGTSRFDLEGGDPSAARRLHYEEDQPFGPERTRQCEAPWTHPFIDRGGRVFPCCHGDGTSVMGTLGEASFDAIWNGEAFRRFRDDLVAGTALPSSCRKCINAPLGPHPSRFSAEILWDDSELVGRDDLRLVVRNNGIAAWDSERPLRIGTINDRHSEQALPSWVAPDRIATIDHHVPPGACATFTFSLGPVELVAPERFGLVFESIRWVPEMEFHLPRPVPAPIEPPPVEVPPPMIRVDPAWKAVLRPYLGPAWRAVRRVRWRAEAVGRPPIEVDDFPANG